MPDSTTDIHALHYAATEPDRPDLLLAEVFYRWGVDLRQWLYRIGVLRTRKLPVPVISVGNLTTGGTGKTPVVISLAQTLEKSGRRVAVLSRGYGARVQKLFTQATHPDFGDEAYLIQQNLQTSKVFVGANRFYVGKQAIKQFQPDIILLDDGFQHWGLYRDLDIILVDGQKGFGNGHMLPAGPLRESFTALSRASVVLLTKTDDLDLSFPLEPILAKYAPHLLTFIKPVPFVPQDLLRLSDQSRHPFNVLAGQAVWLLSGIAQPSAFKDMVTPMAGRVVTHQVFDDHINYTVEDLAQCFQALAADPTLKVVMTEKDAVKLQHMLSPEILHRMYALTIAPEADWQDVLAEYLPFKSKVPVTPHVS